MTDNVDNNVIKNFNNQFIEEENILEKTSNKFEEKRNKIIDESNQSKKKFNILVIGPTGSGKSTLINEFFQIDEAEESYGDIGTLGFHPYTTDDSEYTLIDSQGLDYSKSLIEYSISLENYIIESNKTPSTFIDMIYYCTNNPTRCNNKK
jgi:predicted GTPase